MNPKDFFSDAMIRPPLPGEVWNFTKDEAHCFSMEIGRLSGFSDEEEPGASHWKVAVVEALSSGGSKTNSTPELFAHAEAFVAAARAHVLSLRPEDPEMWRRALSDPIMRLDAGISEEEAGLRFDDAEAGIVRIPCGHTATEHNEIMLGWYVRNIQDTKFRRATLYRVWLLPAGEVLRGKQFIARYDMESEISEHIDAMNSSVSEHMDPETRDQLVMDVGMTPDAADEMLEGMREARIRDIREQLLEKYKNLYRILD